MNVDNSILQSDQNEQPEHINMSNQPFVKKWAGLVVLSLALAIIVIDTTLLNVSLKTIIKDLNTNLHSMQWVITIYSLILAAFTITGGRLGDLFGRKKMFVIGAIIFAIGSFLASISKSIGFMITGEAIVEGIGAALMMPATASLLVTNYKGRDRAVAFGVWGGIAAASSAIGPILGGWLTTNYSWRWGFRINILVVALVLIGSLLIKENHQLRTKSKIDFIGILLSSLGLLSIVFGFIQASTFGWFKAKEQLVFLHHTLNLGSLSATPLFIVLGLIILAGFMFWERYYENRGSTPLLSLNLFRNKQFVVGSATTAILALGQSGLFFTIPVFLQAVRGLDALHTGLTLLPMSLALLVAAPLSAVLIKYIKPKRLVQIGLSLSALAFLVLIYSLKVDATAWHLAPGFIIFGFGMGLIMAQVSNITLSAVSAQEAGEASGVNNTLRMVGQTLGSAILGAVLLSALTSNVNTSIADSKIIPDQAKTTIEQNVSKNISDISFGGNASTNNNPLPQTITNELKQITQQGIVDANKTVMVYGIIFIVLGILVSTQLSNNQNLHPEEQGPETDAEENNSGSNSYTPLAQPLSNDNTSTPTPTKKSRAKLYLGILLAAVIIGGVIIASQNSKDKNSSNPEIVVTGSSDDPRNSIEFLRGQEPSDSNNTSNQNLTAPQTDNQPQVENYNNDQLKFSFDKPKDWQVTKQTANEVTFQAANGVIDIQTYQAQGANMEGLKNFLSSQSNISNITQEKIDNKDVYQFNIKGIYEHGYAFTENNRLYYILGATKDNNALKNFSSKQ